MPVTFLEVNGRYPYKNGPCMATRSPRELQELCIAANFVEVFLAREGHSARVGINYLEKVQFPHLPSLYGAMLAGVAYVLMGAGIPLKIPGVLDSFTHHRPATYSLQASGAQQDDDTTMTFTPRDFMEHDLPPLARPAFLAITASNTLAATIIKKANGRVDGFVIEGPTAGGHNAPPRGKAVFNEAGEPVYGERDVVILPKLRELELPFWLAGGYGRPEKVREALGRGSGRSSGGHGVCFLQRIGPDARVQERGFAGSGGPAQRPGGDGCTVASPTNFPFKVVRLEGSVTEPDVYAGRAAYLRSWVFARGLSYRRRRDRLSVCRRAGDRIQISPRAGKQENTVGRKCLCNALMANIGLPQLRKDKYVEKGLITAGNGLAEIARFLPVSGWDYSAAVVRALLDGRVADSPAIRPLDAAGTAIESG